ncbi:MAG: hypothetical protein LBM73_01990 [Candidatus Nomurabacteria bacterium]|jgi:sporulation protein YlmC with PRC-barrel domain|nr:hypothetical protein [Candidatus Nomurabacteria bacterium]
MLLTLENLVGMPVMSLQTGRPLAQIYDAIVDPRNLKIAAFYVRGPLVDFDPAVLFPSDIRELGQMGAIVDSSDRIMPTDGLVRLEKILDFGFTLNNILVVDDQKKKLGRVENYSFDPSSGLVQKLYVKPGFWKSFALASLTIGRSQIIAIDNSKITVKAPTVKAAAKAPLKIANQIPFENPFRGRQTPAPENQKN